MATRSIVSIAVSDSDQLQINKINSNFQTVFSMAKEISDSVGKTTIEETTDTKLEGVQKQIKVNTLYITKSEVAATYVDYTVFNREIKKIWDEFEKVWDEIDALWTKVNSIRSCSC